jgi:hypothetical protein
MSKFAYFNPHDGRVLQWIDTEAMAYNLPDASMLHGCSDAEWELRHLGEMMVKNGAVVPYVAPAPDLLQVKSAKWEIIKIERDRRTDQGGYKVGTKWFHSDHKSRSQQLGLVLLGASIPANLQWKTMDGSFVTMTQTLAQQILAAGAASDQAIFSAAETHKAAMEASDDPASYDFSTGWPKVFGE